jgi:hypothetical protein
MLEVKYIRWKAFMQLPFGILLVVSGILLAVCTTASIFTGVVAVLPGMIFIQMARIRLQERDTILRLTPTMVWTKEFGWQPWESLLFVLENTRKDCTLEIHRPTDFTPRFFEWVGTLTINKSELSQWIKRFATNYKIDSQKVGETPLS